MLNVYCLNVLKLLRIFHQSENPMHKTIFIWFLKYFLLKLLLNTYTKIVLPKIEIYPSYLEKQQVHYFNTGLPIIVTAVYLSYRYDYVFLFHYSRASLLDLPVTVTNILHRRI